MTDSRVKNRSAITSARPSAFPVPGWTPRPAPPRTPMQGRFCTVEPLDAERHAADLFAANAEDREGRIWTYYLYGPFAELGEYRRWVEDACADTARLFHAIRDNATGKAVGVGAYLNVQPAIGSVEVGASEFQPAACSAAPGRHRGHVSDDAARVRRARLPTL